MLYTPLFSLWEIFEYIVSMSPFYETGFTYNYLQMKEFVDTYFKRNWTQFEFWYSQRKFLNDLNLDYRTKRNAEQRRRNANNT